jgi:hypothetical protein
MNIKLFIKGAALLGLLLLASCDNLFTPPSVSKRAGEGTLNITLGNGVEGARTLLPSSTSGINHYRLTSDPAGLDETLNPGAPGISVTLLEGTYTITAKAFASDDETPGTEIAAGTAEVEVVPDQSTPVSIVLRVVTSGSGTGSLLWNVPDGWDGLLSGGSIALYAYDEGSNTFSILSGQSNIHSTLTTFMFPVPPGEYLVRVFLTNQDGRSIYYHDVAHIAPGLTTYAVYRVTDEDFDQFTTITGTVQYTHNGVAQTDYTLEIYRRNPPDYDSPLSSAGWAAIAGGSYTLAIPKPDKDVTLYFYIRDSSNSRYYVDSIAIASGASTAGKDINFNRTVTTLSGTLTVDHVALYQSDAMLYIYDADTYKVLGQTPIDSLTASTAWTVPIDQSASPRVAYILFEARKTGGNRVTRDTSKFIIPAGAAPVSGLNYTVDLAPYIRGTVQLTAGESTITNPQVSAYSDAGALLGGPVAVNIETITQPGGSIPGLPDIEWEIGTFSIPITASYSGNFYLQFSANVNNVLKSKITRNFSDRHFSGYDREVGLGAVNITVNEIKVSGNIYSAQMNGSPYQGYLSIYLRDHTTHNYVSSTSCFVNNNTPLPWAIYMDSQSSRLLDLAIELDNAKVYESTASVGAADVDFGYASISAIKVHGTLTMQDPYQGYLDIALKDNSNATVGSTTRYVGNYPENWSITLKAQASSRPLQLVISQRGSETPVYNGSIDVGDTGVDVGSITISSNIVKVSGTLNVQVNGSPYQGDLSIYLRDPDTSTNVYNTWLNTSGAGNASWSIDVEKQDSPRTLNLVIYMNSSGRKLYEQPISVGNTEVNVGHLNLSTNNVHVSGTLTMRAGGSPYQGEGYIDLYETNPYNYVGSTQFVTDAFGNASWSIAIEQAASRPLELSIDISPVSGHTNVYRQTIGNVGAADVDVGHLDLSYVLVSGPVYVTINGTPLDDEFLTATIVEETAPGQYSPIGSSYSFQTDSGNGFFTIAVPAQDPAKTLQLMIFGSLNTGLLYSGDITVGSANYNVPQLNLNLTMSSSTGTVKQNGVPIGGSTYSLYIYDQLLTSPEQAMSATPLATSPIASNGSISLTTPSGLIHGYVVIVNMSGDRSGTAYIRTALVSLPFTNQNFELNEMQSMPFSF